MTPEQQRIAIAEACGWTVINKDHFKILHAPHHPPGIGLACGKHLSDEDCFRAFLDSDETEESIPDYLNDLNAMHEAEKWLNNHDSEKACAYDLEWLPKVVGAVDHPSGLVNTMRLYHATAAQRAEAFLKSIGKWKED